MTRSSAARPASPSATDAAVQQQDVVALAAGPWGRWQAKQAVMLALLKLPIGWFQLSILFLAPPQQHWCQDPPPQRQEPLLDSCHAYERLGGQVVPCQHWEFNRTVFPETIVSEWSLVCARHQLANVSQLVLMFGVLVGNIGFGVAADRWGRRAPLLWAIVLQAAAGVATAFVSWLWLFMALRFLVAVAVGGTMVVSFVMCMEIVGGPWRTIVPILYQIPFAAGVSYMAGVAYFLRHWRHFQLALGVCSVPFLAYYWFIQESPRWLLAVGREQEAFAILEDAARMNGRDVADAKIALLQNRERCRGSAALSDTPGLRGLLRTPRLRNMSLCLFFTWFVVGLAFFGFTQLQGQIGGDIFVNVTLTGIISIPGPVLCVYLVRVLGRKACILASLLVSSAASMLIIAVPLGAFPGDWPRTLLAAVAVLGLSVTFPALYLYSGELLPTVVRNVGLGTSSMCARVGSMAASFVLTLAVYGDYVPLVTLGGLPLVGALLMLPLPETRDCVLPDSLEDGENFCRRRAKDDMKNANYIQVPLKEVVLAEVS